MNIVDALSEAIAHRDSLDDVGGEEDNLTSRDTEESPAGSQ